ncbi:hypothetical protein [Metabacillus sp. RGM 3146]|uniref:hypothetical protein n=1 Tax=Metabacillus sp. RGM 3146 TaxID=3401092 RepID=UPI003B994DA9
MEEVIRKLKEKYAVNIQESKHKQFAITVYPKNSIGEANQDVGYKLFNQENDWFLVNLQRDKEYPLAQFTTKETGFFALYLATIEKKDISNDPPLTELSQIEDNLENGEPILKKSINIKFFSLKEEKKGAIYIYEENGKFNVYYLNLLGEKIWITKGRALSTSLEVVYNYAKRLEEFEEIIAPWKSTLSIQLKDEELLKRTFIRK